ncbi:MAG: restriction endonuclease subunit S, partial [Methanothrix soehngenii]|nr:restriction endonuclease subunit S [Methanothrix soehngenii]
APSRNEQRAIARILGTLDDKIELNRGMNETLETIARAIFKSWFVDFDPVRAKAEGREPAGMDSETAALFPDSFEETELGMVPKGWNFGTIGQDYNLIMGQSPPSETYNKEKNGVPFFQGRTDFGNRYPSVRIYCINPTRIANSGDTLISVRAPVGDINIASVKCCIGRGLSAIRHKSESCSFTFYMMLSLKKFFAQFEAEGTVFGSMNKKDFQEIACISPPKEIIKKFEKVIFPFDKMIWNNEVESKILASVRDSVIPILVSGTIRFCDNYRCERVLL